MNVWQSLGAAAVAIAIAATGVTGVSNGEVTRTSRVSSTSEVVRESRTPKSGGIQTGEWQLQGGLLEVLFVSITEDTGSENLIKYADPEWLGEEMGFPFERELNAPDGCRLFEYSLDGFPVYLAWCGTNDYMLVVMGTDRSVVNGVMTDFLNGDPFTAPYGYKPAG